MKRRLSSEWFDERDMNTYTVDMKSRVGERGQITIPKTMRDRLGIRSGQEIEFEEHKDFLVMRKVVDADSLAGLRGLVSWRGSVDEYLVESRGPAWNAELDGEQ